MYIRRLILLLTAGLTLAAGRPLTAPRPLMADHTVGNGDSSACTEAALHDALGLGGSIDFNCGPNPTIILFNLPIAITTTASLDGGGLVTLSGQNQTALFYVAPSTTLTLTQLTLSNGFAANDGGAIYNELGARLVVDHSLFQDNHTSANFSGGAIINYGTLAVRDSTFVHNSAGNGGAIYPRFAASSTTIQSSVFTHNSTTNTTNGWGGAILEWDGAPVTVQNSQFISNTAQIGGAVYVFPNSSLTLTDSLATDNLADAGPDGIAWAGAIYNNGRLALQDTDLDNNRVRVTFPSPLHLTSGSGGAIYNDGSGTIQMTRGELSGNLAQAGSALESHGDASLDTVNVLNNVAGGNTIVNVGSLANYLTISATTLSGNHALGSIIQNNATLTMTNATVSSNSALAILTEFNSFFTLANVTLANNTGYGFWRLSGSTGTINVYNSLLAYNTLGNCHEPLAATVLHSLSSDQTCGFGVGKDQIDPLLSPLGYHYGPTWTQMIPANSPAVDNGANCPATDQRGVSRPQGNACDIGAVERRANDAMDWLFVALVRR